MPLRDQVQERVVQAYIHRLFNSVGRSAILKAFPTRTVKRIDLIRFRVADESAPEQLVKSLVSPEGKYRLIFREYRQIGDRGAQSQALFTTLHRKLSREAQAVHRETGLWMLWLAYPLLYVPHPSSDREDYLLAPLFLWPINISSRTLPEGEVYITREQGAPRFNRIARQWIHRNLDFDPPEPTGHELLELQTFEHLRELVKRCCKGFNPPIENLIGSRIESVPERSSLIKIKIPHLYDAGIIGLIQWENMELLADLEKLHKMEELTGPAGDLLRERKQPKPVPLKSPLEADRFLVTDTDNTQERAIWMARRPEGVVVHGPPGTGKSQVIVNIVADTLAHGEKVIVVCQKKAALDVVAARLRKVGLGELFIQIDDSEGDRRRVIEILRDQGQPVITLDHGERNRIADEIEQLEKQFEEYNSALFKVQDRYGINYRTMLARIASIERKCIGVKPLEILREKFINAKDVELHRLVDTLAQIEDLFWESDFLSNPWRRGGNDLTGDKYQLQNIENDINKALPFTKAVDRWANQKGPVGGKLSGNLEAIRDSTRYLAQSWSMLNTSIISKAKPEENQTATIKDVNYKVAAKAVEGLVKKRHSLFRMLSPSFYRDIKNLRDFIGRRKWLKENSANQILYAIAERTGNAAACEHALKSIERWLHKSESGSFVTLLCTGESVTPHLNRLREYIPRLPILLRFRATVVGFNQWDRDVSLSLL